MLEQASGHSILAEETEEEKWCIQISICFIKSFIVTSCLLSQATTTMSATNSVEQIPSW
jgi:hypothetical protein